MGKFGTRRGQSWRELAIRTCRKSWDDEVFGQAARLAFYYFLSMFPALLLLLIVLGQITRTGSTGSELQDTLAGAIQQILPGDTKALIARTVGQLNAEALVGAGAVFAALSSVWAALNGTWAMISGLNTAYEVEEDRPWWKVLSVAFGLTVSMGVMGIVALWIMYYGSRAGKFIGNELGNHGHTPLLWHIVQWPVTLMLLFFSLALLYRFGPNGKDRRWKWSFPGAFVAVVLWMASTLLFGVYQSHFSSQRIYGGLNAAAALLLWLYFTAAAIFIGGETNSQIEKASAKGWF